MIRHTPFHARTAELNRSGLWTHWAGYLVAQKYQLSEKFEYFAFRNAAGLFDTSPLYKYRITGQDAEPYLAGVLTRDPRTCAVGQAQYTVWCDDKGFVIEDGVLLRTGQSEYLLTAAERNLAYLQSLTDGYVLDIEDVSPEIAAVALQGPNSRKVLAEVVPEAADLGYFRLMEAKIDDTVVTISRTGFTGDLGYEVWVDAAEALQVWDAFMEAGSPYGLIPVGLQALKMARIEAGLLLLDTDFGSSRFAFNDAHRSTPGELGLGWMVRKLADDERRFVGRNAIEAELANGTSRWAMVGLVVDWADFDGRYEPAGLVPPKDHTPVTVESMVYDGTGNGVGYTTSSMYSPMLQRHIAIARVRPDLAAQGTAVFLEYTIDHVYEKIMAHVTRLPFFNPPRKTASA